MASEQEEFWTGSFGKEYAERNMNLVQNNVMLFDAALEYTFDVRQGHGLKTILELGAGTGQNIAALAQLTEAELWAVELNKEAADHIAHGNVIVGNVLDVEIPIKADLVLTKGLLIHIHPDELGKMYQRLYDLSNRYILIAEYYNPTPVMVEYHGEKDKLWKRDFAGELLHNFPDLELVDYGFVYHRDLYPQDDITWFLLEKKSGRPKPE